MEEFDLTKSLDEPLKPINTPEGTALKNPTEAPTPVSLESILPRLPPEEQVWVNGLNAFCRRAVEHDLRVAGPDLVSWSIGSLFATPCKSSNATSVHLMNGSSFFALRNC
jgi:hypothetical protein